MPSYLLIIITILLSAFFSGMEIAFISANKLKLELDKKSKSFTARVISIFTKHESYFIVTMLVGNNIALVIYGVIMAEVINKNLSDYISSAFPLIIVQTIISTLIILIVAEFIPKAIFRINPNRFLKFFSLPLIISYIFLYPIILLMIIFSRWILKVFFKVEIAEDQRLFSRVDLDAYLSMLKSQEYDNMEVDMLQNALELTNIKIRECMVPRTEIIATNLRTDISELKDKFIKSKHSKILIYKENIDNIIGYVHSLDLFKKPKKIKSILMPIPIIAETMAASDLLKLFVNQQKGVAAVVDEFGGTSGMVTIEDVTEEIVGEIEDEHDTETLIDKKINENTFLFSARMEINMVNNKYNLQLPISEEYETLAGLLLTFYEDIPEPETEIEIESYKFIVKEVSDRSIQLIEVHLS